MPRWRNGRRSGLKIRFPYGSGGSNPFLGTTFDVILEAPLMNPLVRRISNLDLIRGIALLGILGMNAISFGLPWAAYWNLSAAGSETWLDFAIGVFCEIFLDQKMMGLFSLLFGTSIVLLVDAAKERGYRRPVLLSVWRNLLLFIIGIIHSLFWDGDVLRLYAICAPIVLLLRNSRPRLLVAFGIFLVVGPATLTLLLQPLFLSDGSLDMTTNWAMNVGDGIGLGKYWFVESSTFGATVGLFFLLDNLGRALGMMLIGVALYRMNILHGNRSLRFYRLVAITGLLIGLPLSSIGTGWLITSDFANTIALVSLIPNTLATIPTVLGYIGIISIWDSKVKNRLHTHISAIGRMALSNYLLQTVLGIVILRVILEQGTLGRSQIALFVIFVWALQLIWSKPWLDKFSYGPCELILRKLYRW